MKNVPTNVERNRRDFDQPASVQHTLNLILKEIVHGRIATEKELLCEIKRRWQSLDFHEFSNISDFVISMAAVMDEALKVFRPLRCIEKVIHKQIDDVYMACSDQGQSMEAWMFWSKGHVKKEILSKAMHCMEMTFPHKDWVVHGIDLTTGKHDLRVKKRYGIIESFK